MELLCEKCRRLVETRQCPFCGSPETREPENGDYCCLAVLDGSGAAILAGKLKLSGIDFRMQAASIGRVKLMYVFYVPYGRIEDAWSEIQKLWGDDHSVTAEYFEGTGTGLFDADEIDRMEASMLDSMDLEELKAYRSKIMKTLKEIRVQEQKWKQRTNILLDMKEEAECLIEDLS